MKINIYTYDNWYDDGNIFNGLNHLSLLIHLDITKRFLCAANIECEINVVVLLGDESKSIKLQFPTEISEQQHLLSYPNVLGVYQKDSEKWPSGDIVYMPKIFGEFPQTENPPEWMRFSNTLPVFIISEDDKKYCTSSQLINMNWSADDIRTLLTINRFPFDVSLDDAIKSVQWGNKIRQLLINKKVFKTSHGRSKLNQSIEVLLGKFHKEVDSLFDPRRTVIPFNVKIILDVFDTCIAPILEYDPEALSKYEEIEQFYNVCLFALFPQDCLNMRLGSCALPLRRDDLISRWEHERFLSIPIQVDGKIRGQVTLTADEALDQHKVWELACRIPQVNRALGDQPPAKVKYVGGRILSLQSANACLMRKEKKRKNDIN